MKTPEKEQKTWKKWLQYAALFAFFIALTVLLGWRTYAKPESEQSDTISAAKCNELAKQTENMVCIEGVLYTCNDGFTLRCDENQTKCTCHAAGNSEAVKELLSSLQKPSHEEIKATVNKALRETYCSQCVSHSPLQNLRNYEIQYTADLKSIRSENVDDAEEDNKLEVTWVYSVWLNPPQGCTLAKIDENAADCQDDEFNHLKIYIQDGEITGTEGEVDFATCKTACTDRVQVSNTVSEVEDDVQQGVEQERQEDPKIWFAGSDVGVTRYLEIK